MDIFTSMYIDIAIGWTIYFVIHSILASNISKKTCKEKLPFIFPFYRIIFNIIAIVGLLIMAEISLSDKNILFEVSILLKIFSAIFFIFGLIILAIAFSSFNTKEFLGLEKNSIKSDDKLIVKGIYAYVRHPLYTGTILVLIGVFLYLPTISLAILCIIAFLYIEIGSRLEEKKLIEEFGNEYVEYAKTAKRYFPFLY